MEWSRAKTVLLVAFFILNVVLVQEIHGQRTGSGLLVTALTSTDIQQAQAELADRNIHLNARIPRQLVSLPRLVVRPGTADTETLPPRILGSDYLHVAKYVGVNAYQLREREELLVLWEDGRGYHGPTRRQGFDLTGQLSGWLGGYLLKLRAQGFMATYPLPDAHRRFDYAVDLGDNHQAAVFVEEFSGYPIFGSNVVVWFQDRQPLGLSWNSLQIMGFTEPERAVWPASEALLAAAAADVLVAGATVEDITLGYFVEVTDAVSWETVPVWRLLLASGRQVLINAYTGEAQAGPSWVNVDGSRGLTGP